MNALVVFTAVFVVAGLIVLLAIGVSNWRAAVARKTARRWASARTGSLQ